jgi:hypothetical protein
MNRKGRDGLANSADQVLQNPVLGIRGIGSMLYWVDANTEPPHDFVGEAGIALEARATLANECLGAVNAVEVWEQFPPEKNKTPSAQPVE